MAEILHQLTTTQIYIYKGIPLSIYKVVNIPAYAGLQVSAAEVPKNIPTANQEAHDPLMIKRCVACLTSPEIMVI